MPWVTEEEIQAAKNMTAYEYLRTHQAQRLQKTRTRNEWQLTDHDSFKINELSSKWHWKSRDIGGVSALRFLIEVDGMKFSRRFRSWKEPDVCNPKHHAVQLFDGDY